MWNTKKTVRGIKTNNIKYNHLNKKIDLKDTSKIFGLYIKQIQQDFIFIFGSFPGPICLLSGSHLFTFRVPSVYFPGPICLLSGSHLFTFRVPSVYFPSHLFSVVNIKSKCILIFLTFLCKGNNNIYIYAKFIFVLL